MPLKRLTLPWDELNDNAYNGGKRLIRDLGRQVKGIGCQLYRDTPGALIPNPASNFLTGMWDGICSDDPQGLPPPPAPPFSGGQCCNKRYNVTITFYSMNVSLGGVGEKSITFTSGGSGKILGLSAPASDGQLYQMLVEYCGQSPAWFNTPLRYRSPDSGTVNITAEYGHSAGISSVAPTDGSVDDCGSLPPVFPPVPPDYTPPSGDIIINPRPDAPDGGFDITIPFAWIDADLNVNVDLRPKIDVGGIEITFDIGGINFEFNSDNPPPTYAPDINPLPDTLFPPAPLPPPGWGDIQVDIDNTNNIVNDIDTKIDTKADKTDIPDYQDELDRIEVKIDSLPPPPPPLVPCATGKQNFVRVTANVDNYVGKTIFTDDDNETVIFGGYIRFLIDGEPYGEELPIRRLVHHFLMPPWATGYRLVPQNQVVLSGVIVEKTVDLPEVTLLDCSGGMA